MSVNLLVRLAQELDKRSIPYMIIGGQAVLLYGEPRLTRDIDITLGLTPDEFSKVADVVQQIGLKVLVDDAEGFVRETWVFPTLHEESGLRVDFIFSWTPYEKEALQRARVVVVKETPVRFASPEDVVIHKMLAGRPRDVEDVVSILRKQLIDVLYVSKWLEQFDSALGQDMAVRFRELLKSLKEEENE